MPDDAANTEVLEFALIRREKEIVLTGHDGSKDTYVIREMTGAVRDQFYGEMAAKAKPTADGRSTVTDYKNLQSLLISKCLYCHDKPVDIRVINEWPAHVQDGVYKLCEKVNAVGKDAEEETKND